jgi:tRNA threonylcarbamoyl adenosine modification protein YeaZ
MKILAIDTSTKFLCLGVSVADRIYEYNLELSNRLSSFITVSIERVLRTLGLEVEEIDYFACGLGPGSFTGLRVGLATVKGLAFSTCRPLVGVSTLDVLARSVKPDGNIIVPIVDAKRKLVYTAFYQYKSGSLKRLSPYRLWDEPSLLNNLQAGSILLGDALGLYQQTIRRSCPAVVMLEQDYWYPQPHNLLLLAKEKIASGQLDNPFSLKPLYLYPQDCQVKNALLSSHLRRG